MSKTEKVSHRKVQKIMSIGKILSITIFILWAMVLGPHPSEAFLAPRHAVVLPRYKPLSAASNVVVRPAASELSRTHRERGLDALRLSAADVIHSPSIMTSADIMIPGDDESMAFSDSINLFDGPILIIFGVFGAIIAALVVIKLLGEQMDSAIEQVLVDFERTMKESYPQRWQNDIRPVLESLEGEERQQKLVKIMEDMQTDDPNFMSRVQEKMKKP